MASSIETWLRAATRKLKNAGIDSARLDCLLLLEDELGLDRASILAHQDNKIPQLTEVALNTKIAQRAKHRPLAYLRGKVQFYGREHRVVSAEQAVTGEMQGIATGREGVEGLQRCPFVRQSLGLYPAVRQLARHALDLS